jgi:hypothetical protein
MNEKYRIEDAARRRQEAHSLRDLAYLRRRGARDAMDLYAQSGYWTSGS